MAQINSWLQRYAPHIAMAFVLLGTGLRLWLYFQGRPLFIDEANLALNIAERGPTGFTSALDHEQYAPPLFMLLTEVIVGLWGLHEYSLRLWPLLASIAALFLLRHISKQTLPGIWSVVPVMLLAFNFDAIRYASEFKQYSSDLCITLVLLALALRMHGRPWQLKHQLAIGLVGMASVWLSMPSIFMLAAWGLQRLLVRHSMRRQIILPGAIWLGGFALWFFGIALAQTSETALKDYHAPYFLNPALLLEDPRAALRPLLHAWQPSFGYSWVAFLPSIILALVGIVHLCRTQRPLLWWLGGPILFTYVAAAVEMYSMIGRMMLFMMPLAILLYVHGLRFTGERWLRSWQWLLLVLPIWVAADRLKAPKLNGFVIEDIHGITSAVKDRIQPGECVFVEQGAVPAWKFYQHHYTGPHPLPEFQSEVILGVWSDRLDARLMEADCRGSFWVVMTNVWPDRDKGWYAQGAALGKVSDHLSVQGGLAFRVTPE